MKATANTVSKPPRANFGTAPKLSPMSGSRDVITALPRLPGPPDRDRSSNMRPHSRAFCVCDHRIVLVSGSNGRPAFRADAGQCGRACAAVSRLLAVSVSSSRAVVQAMEFALGLLIGAILGVVADRIWERIETRPRFTFSPSVRYPGDPTPRNGELILTIRNASRHYVPAYDLVLQFDATGSFTFSDDHGDKPLGPTQKRDHVFNLKNLKHALDFFDAPDRPKRWGLGLSERVNTTRRPWGLTLKLVVSGGDQVLFASRVMGDAFGELMVEAAREGAIGVIDWESFRNK